MTPIFILTWLMKMTVVRLLAMMLVSLRSARLISRACRPMVMSPISPSTSSLGTRAATLSMTITSRAFERTSASTTSRACSAESGWWMRSASMLTRSSLA